MSLDYPAANEGPKISEENLELARVFIDHNLIELCQDLASEKPWKDSQLLIILSGIFGSRGYLNGYLTIEAIQKAAVKRIAEHRCLNLLD